MNIKDGVDFHLRIVDHAKALGFEERGWTFIKNHCKLELSQTMTGRALTLLQTVDNDKYIYLWDTNVLSLEIYSKWFPKQTIFHADAEEFKTAVLESITAISK